MDRDKAIGKIKKCLALASSSNAHEAAAAMRQAQKLMLEHGVSPSDVSLADVGEHTIRSPSNTVSTWQSALARMVAEAFGCELYYCRHAKLVYNRVRRDTDVVFVGVGPAAEIAGYAFDVLLRQAIRDRLAHISEQSKRLKQRTKTARGDAFALAWVAAVQEQIYKFVGADQAGELLVEYMRVRHADLGQFKPTERHLSRHVRSDSYAAGHRAGEKARIDRAVSGEGPRPARLLK